MKLLKAIEILNDLQTTLPQFDPDDRLDAVKLGIQALARIEHCRKWSHYAVKEPLPGETPENETG